MAALPETLPQIQPVRPERFMSHPILIVEDDIPLAQQIKEILEQQGYSVTAAHTAEEGLHLAKIEKPDLILLDVMVPLMGGWELCRRLRQTMTVPILFLTALTNSESIVQGLNLGADDYITKPFNEDELLARIAAHLRRQTGLVGDRLLLGDGELDIDFDSLTVRIDGEIVDLTPREYALLVALARNHGRVMRIEELLVTAWGKEYADARENIKPYIHYLRKKIERDPASPRWINTVRGVGYRFGN